MCATNFNRDSNTPALRYSTAIYTGLELARGNPLSPSRITSYNIKNSRVAPLVAHKPQEGIIFLSIQPDTTKGFLHNLHRILENPSLKRVLLLANTPRYTSLADTR